MQNIKKAENLGEILRAFRIDLQDVKVFTDFYFGGTMAIRTGMKNKSPVDIWRVAGPSDMGALFAEL